MMTGGLKKHLLSCSFSKIVILVALCFLSYGSNLNGTFVFDDAVAIKQNTAIAQLPTNYTAIFTCDFWGAPISSIDSHKSYRPLTSLMFHWEWVKWKLEPQHMKTINLLIHTVNSILVFLVLRQLDFTISCENVALAASTLFAVHPVHTEAVSGIVSRADLMFCLIYLMCLFMCSSHWRDFCGLPAIIIGLTCIGVLFKETAITIPLACIFITYAVDRVYTLSWRQQAKELLCKTNICYICSTVAILIARLWLAEFKSPKFRAADNPVAHADSLTTRLLSQSYLYFHNIYILFNPLYLCFDWSFGCIQLVETFSDCRLLSVICLHIIVVFYVINYKQNFPAFVALGILAIPFIPASGIIKVGFVIAERVLYVPSIGFCYLVASEFTRLYNKFVGYREYLRIGFGLTILIFILRCRQRSSEWLTEEKLFASALHVCPNNAKVHYNIARLATDVKDNTKAFRHYHNAIELAPDYDAALMNLGNLYREIGKLSEAEKYLKKSLEISPDFATAWMNLGIVQSGAKHYKEAAESYANALKYRKNYANCYYNMGNMYLDQLLYTEALSHWQNAVNINPRLQKAWTNMLTLLDSKGLFEDALRKSDQALKHLPNENSILFLRANVFGKLGRYIEAEELYKRIVSKEPMNYLYHTNLAVLYHRWNRLQDAINSYKIALDVNPEKATTARDNLSKLISRLAKEKN